MHIRDNSYNFFKKNFYHLKIYMFLLKKKKSGLYIFH